MHEMVYWRGHRALRLGRFSASQHVYHISTSTHLRQRLFTEFYAARAVARCLNNPDSLHRSDVLAWVVMPDHVHVLLRLGEGVLLSKVVNGVKGSAARAVNLTLQRAGPVWQRSFHDHAIRSEENLATVSRYIVENPIRAGLVRRLSDYPHWDAYWL